MRPYIIIAGVLLLLFGLACFNYTKATAWEHHKAFARQHQLPEPSNAILVGGIVAVGLGAGMIGYSVGAHVRSRAGTPASVPPTSKSN